MRNIGSRLDRLEDRRAPSLATWIKAVDQDPEEAKAEWRAAHPDRAGEKLSVIAHRIVDPPAHHSATEKAEP